MYLKLSSTVQFIVSCPSLAFSIVKDVAWCHDPMSRFSFIQGLFNSAIQDFHYTTTFGRFRSERYIPFYVSPANTCKSSHAALSSARHDQDPVALSTSSTHASVLEVHMGSTIS